MSLRLRLLAAFVLALAGPLGVALALVDADLRDELLVFGLAVLIGIAIAVPLSAAAARPLRDLATGASRIAGGEYGTRVAEPLDAEGAGIARAINDLSDRLRSLVTDADASRDEVRNSVRRLGEALRSTGPKDLSKLLSVVLETAIVAVRARAGAIFLLSANRSELYVKIGRHMDPSIGRRRIQLGEGLAGWVAEQRRPAIVPSSDPPVPADPEPSEDTSLAVPLESRSQLLGVLALYGRAEGDRFDEGDLEIIDSLARQAGIGIENVLLHQEAERLSITDGLTGVWNRRYFQMQLGQDFQRALRWQRPLSLLVIDIDHFKAANDRFGHQRGDAVLVELAQRVVGLVRHGIDTFARYGGEEFVVILPETGDDGAAIVAEKVRAAVADLAFGTEAEERVGITVSVGYATYPGHGMTPQVLLHAADLAMYRAKAEGRNRIAAARSDDGSTLAADPRPS